MAVVKSVPDQPGSLIQIDLLDYRKKIGSWLNFICLIPQLQGKIGVQNYQFQNLLIN